MGKPVVGEVVVLGFTNQILPGRIPMLLVAVVALRQLRPRSAGGRGVDARWTPRVNPLRR